VTAPGEHRETARVLLKNPDGHVFMLLTHFDPEVGLSPRWLTPGGAIEPQEDVRAAAARELLEETGISVAPEDLGERVARISGKWIWADGQNFHTFTDNFFELTVQDFVLDDSGWTQDERRDVLKYRWWTPDELLATEELIGPPELVSFILNR
jgi:8-oxo-dGTP pyrophosphatase MutT (NUDIX family)